MAEVKVVGSGDVPPKVLKELEAFVTKQCLQLHSMEVLMGTPERGKEVADFMKQAVGKFLSFTLPERALVVQFMSETNIAVQATMEASGLCKPLSAYKSELDRLLRTSALLGKDAYTAYIAGKREKP